MTGRDLIIYILENGLEDEEMFKNGKIVGLMSDTEAAVKFGVGVQTVRAWITLGYLDSVLIGCVNYIPANSKNPSEIQYERVNQ